MQMMVAYDYKKVMMDEKLSSHALMVLMWIAVYIASIKMYHQIFEPNKDIHVFKTRKEIFFLIYYPNNHF